jgi:ABC-type molybdate transport system substrate-binding protein
VRLLVLAALVAALVVPAATAAPRLTVHAASSLTEVFPRIESRSRYDFAGSDDLASGSGRERGESTVRYELAVVSSSRHQTAARVFVAWVLGEVGRGHLRAAGFLFP